MGHAVLQKLVMDVLAIGGEDRAPADQAANDGEHRLQNGEAKRYDRNRHGDDRGGLLSSMQGKSTQQKSDEQAAGVTKENGRRIEVESEESQDCSG